jgi:hypothetical protein
MNLIKLSMLFTLIAAPVLSRAGDENDICAPVFKACAEQGFAKDDTAPAGKKIWLNCADVILNRKKAVQTVDVDPNGFDASNCRDYRKAKDKFDAEWVAKHPHQD